MSMCSRIPAHRQIWPSISRLFSRVILILGMNLSHGGHLSHGSPANFSGKFYKIVPYGVSKDTETIDFAEVEKLAKEHKPKMIIVGASAYPRTLDFQRFRKIADEVGAVIMADIAHIAGLVATGLHPTPVPVCEYVTSTTHKTLRGPRGGLIMCKEAYAKTLNSRVFPGSAGRAADACYRRKGCCF